MSFAVVFSAKKAFEGASISKNKYEIQDEFPYLSEDNIKTEREAKQIKTSLEKNVTYVLKAEVIPHD